MIETSVGQGEDGRLNGFAGEFRGNAQLQVAHSHRFLREGTRKQLHLAPDGPKPAQYDVKKDKDSGKPEGNMGVTINSAQARKIMMGMSTVLQRRPAFKSDFEARRQELETAAVKVQAWYRMTRIAYSGPLAFLHRRKKEGKEKAASTVQRVYRAHVARHSADMELRIEFRLLDHAAAVQVQKVARGHMGRVKFQKVKVSGLEEEMDLAVRMLQKHARGWKSRRATKAAIQAKARVVHVIERFCIRFFQPWLRVQNKLWDNNLWSIVSVQSRTKCFLAKKRATELRKTRADMLAKGKWMVLWAAFLGLFLLATVLERGYGAPSTLRLSFETHFESSLDGVLAAGDVSSPYGVWEWIQGTLIPRYRTIHRSPWCTEADANVRGCVAPDGMPLHKVRNLSVRQHRSELAMYLLSNAGSETVLGLCGDAEITGVGVCMQKPPGQLLEDQEHGDDRTQGYREDVNISNATQLASAHAAMQRLKEYQAGNYSKGQSVLLSREGAAVEDRGVYGSMFLNFSVCADRISAVQARPYSPLPSLYV